MAHIAFFLALCSVCNRGVTVRSLQRDADGDHLDLTKFNFDYPGAQFQILELHPSKSVEVPEAVPSNIASFYAQGVESCLAARWDAAGAMFRKCLDVGTKIVAPTLASKTLYARIMQMVSDRILTESMGDWAHEIRLEGNDAVHAVDVETEEDATIAKKFTEAFLIYAFTLPSMVEENRRKRAFSSTATMDAEAKPR